ncbi:right-handed parallel beta-helix repeat-containing protein [Halobacillus rhizosphaerae]|uniref:hypothetical protein n=1 Tax=Halobacillus rhizosphaerae TaxID=3064889 RepID=UPI00398AB98C
MIFDGNQIRPALAQTEDDPSCEISNLISEEVPQQGGREERVFMLPNGAQVILQRVNIRTTGTITITLEDDSTGSADFSVCESYYLCAPLGTEILVQITQASCHICSSVSSEEGTEVSVDIDFCQDVQSTASVVLDIEASFCNPRDQVERSCPTPTRPPQCPVRFNQENDFLNEECPVLCSIPSHLSPQQEENLCIRTHNVYDWVQTRIDTTVTLTLPPPLPLFCVYEITELDGECTGLALGDVVCFPCELPCDEILQCSNGVCTLVLSLTDNACVDCPPDAVTLPQGFACEVPVLSCLYEVTSVDGECSDLAVGDLICLPCEETCDEALECSNGVCTVILTLTDDACVFCPPDAVSLPQGFACEVLVLSCLYEVTAVEGECTDIVVGDLICLPCETPCSETLECSNDVCTLTLSLSEDSCVVCPQDAVPLPDGFSCFVPMCVYTVTAVEGECGGLEVEDIVCLPCGDGPCGETLICVSEGCSLILQSTSAECIACPPDAVPFPAGLTCSLIGGRIFNVNQLTFYDVLSLAIEEANSGDTLILTPGQYTQDAELIIDKTLTIRGFSAALTEVVFPNTFTAETAISLQADDITLEGLSFTRTTFGVADETLVRIPPRGVGDYYSGITIQNSTLTGGKRTLIVNVEDFTLTNNTIHHNGTEKALEIRGALGTTTITENSFLGSATSLGAIYVQGATPNDLYFSGTFLIDDNTMESHTQFVFFSTASFNNVNIYVRRNTINHMTRAGSSIIFEPFNFPGIDTILIEENNITNPNTMRLAVYVDYRDGGTTAPETGQIQVIRNTLDVATPWGRDFDTVSPDAPVGFTTTGAMVGMSLTAFDLVDNVIVPQ